MTPPFRAPAAALALTALLLVGACSSSDDELEAPASQRPAGALIDYEKDRGEPVTLRGPDDVVKLKGAPEGFKQYMAGVIDESSQAQLDGDCPVRVDVTAIHPDGYAAGAILSCGGAAYMWAERDGIWRRIWSGQEIPACEEMEKFSVPKAIAGSTCRDGDQEVPYKG